MHKCRGGIRILQVFEYIRYSAFFGSLFGIRIRFFLLFDIRYSAKGIRIIFDFFIRLLFENFCQKQPAPKAPEAFFDPEIRDFTIFREKIREIAIFGLINLRFRDFQSFWLSTLQT